jgi:hypothetical protein
VGHEQENIDEEGEKSQDQGENAENEDTEEVSRGVRGFVEVSGG